MIFLLLLWNISSLVDGQMDGIAAVTLRVNWEKSAKTAQDSRRALENGVAGCVRLKVQVTPLPGLRQLQRPNWPKIR